MLCSVSMHVCCCAGQCFHTCCCWEGQCFHICVVVVQGSVSICVAVGQGSVSICVAVGQGSVSIIMCCCWAGQCFHNYVLLCRAVFPSEAYPYALHHTAFINTVTMLATEEQKAKWLPLMKSYRLLGTYAQTEMGHGQ